MKAYLHSAPLAPKKANIIAKMVRGMSVSDAIVALERTHKKGARMIEKLIKSAVANAEHNEKQRADGLVIKSIIVNQGLGYRRGVPKARGQMRPMIKFLSHISLVLGVGEGEVSSKKSTSAKATADKPAKKAAASAKTGVSSSQKSAAPVQKKPSTVQKATPQVPASSDSSNSES